MLHFLGVSLSGRVAAVPPSAPPQAPRQSREVNTWPASPQTPFPDQHVGRQWARCRRRGGRAARGAWPGSAAVCRCWGNWPPCVRPPRCEPPANPRVPPQCSNVRSLFSSLPNPGERAACGARGCSSLLLGASASADGRIRADWRGLQSSRHVSSDGRLLQLEG